MKQEATAQRLWFELQRKCVFLKSTHLFEGVSNVTVEKGKKSKSRLCWLLPDGIDNFTVWTGTYNSSEATDASICNTGIQNNFPSFHINIYTQTCICIHIYVCICIYVCVYIYSLGPEIVQAYIKTQLWLNLYE